jgi:hypothetical protein
VGEQPVDDSHHQGTSRGAADKAAFLTVLAELLLVPLLRSTPPAGGMVGTANSSPQHRSRPVRLPNNPRPTEWTTNRRVMDVTTPLVKFFVDRAVCRA